MSTVRITFHPYIITWLDLQAVSESLVEGTKFIKIQKQPPEVFCKKRCSKNFAYFTWKQLCRSLFLITLQSCEICETFKSTYCEEHLRTTASENWRRNAKLFSFSIKIPTLKTLNIQIYSGSNKFGRNIQISRNKYFSSILASSYRSSHWQVFFKIGILKNFAISTGKYLCFGSLLNRT